MLRGEKTAVLRAEARSWCERLLCHPAARSTGLAWVHSQAVRRAVEVVRRDPTLHRWHTSTTSPTRPRAPLNRSSHALTSSALTSMHREGGSCAIVAAGLVMLLLKAEAIKTLRHALVPSSTSATTTSSSSTCTTK